jgi:hypothetical protein
MIDVNGEYPIYFITRSYAPFEEFGPIFARYKGDNRTNTLDRGASYRTLVSIKHDTELKTTESFGGISYTKSVDGKKYSISPTYVDNRTKKGSNFIDVHSFGNNKAEIGSWDIDQFTKLNVNIEGDISSSHILHIQGTISGDDFPNQESIIYDNEGNTLWLGKFETNRGPGIGPLLNLAGSGESDIQIKIDIKIQVNEDGIFEGVIKDGKLISNDEWNKQFETNRDE